MKMAERKQLKMQEKRENGLYTQRNHSKIGNWHFLRNILARRQWDGIWKIMKIPVSTKNITSKILTEKLRQSENTLDKRKLKLFFIHRGFIYELIQGRASGPKQML